MYKKIQKIHLIGIGGSGMSGIAEVLINLDYKISGSDMKKTDTTERLRKLGAKIQYVHKKENIKDADVVVISSAIKGDNPELVSARDNGIPIISRAEMLAELMRMKYGIAIAGTHGKTTTTSLISTILAHGGLDPTIVIGGRLNSLGTNAKLGQGEFMVAEADESDGSFLKLSPTIVVVTNIDPEHLDYYKEFENAKRAFLEFINKIPFYGQSILCLDEESIQSLLPHVQKRHLTYGLSSQADFMADNIQFNKNETSFDTHFRGKRLGRVTLRMPGQHNVYNSLAAIATGIELDLEFKIIKEALAEFSGIQRRFQIKGIVNGIMVIDDYGHHPKELRAILRAAKNGWNKRVIAIFQPHRYTRTRDLFDEFLISFNQADVLIITDIYPAGESPIDGVNAIKLFEGIRGHGHKDVVYIKDKKEIVDRVLKIVMQDDMVITLGAGNIWSVGEDIIRQLKKAISYKL